MSKKGPYEYEKQGAHEYEKQAHVHIMVMVCHRSTRDLTAERIHQ